MAISGSKSVTVTSWDTLKFSWEEKSQDITNNKTTISWKMELIATSSGRIASTASKDWSVTVNGTKYSGTNTVGISNNATKTLASGTTTITHDSDGKKTFSYSFSQEFAITFSDVYIGTKSGSGSGTLDTIPRKSTLSVGNGTLGTEQTLTVTRQSDNFTHTIVAECGDQSKTICTKSEDESIEFTPPIAWASENTTGTSVSVKYTITTYNGSTSLGSNSYTKTCSIPSSVAPSCSITVTDPTGYADTYGGYIKGLSKFKVVVNATAAQGSAIASYSVTANGSTYTNSSFTTEVLKSSGTLTVKATVKDKRGRSGSASVQKTVLDYSPPVISKLVVGRCNADGTENDQGEYCKVTFSASASSLNNKNSVTYRLYYRKSSDTTAERKDFTEYANIFSVEDVTYIFAADTGSSYVVTLHVIDNFNVEKPTTRTTSVSTGFTLMHWLATGLGMGIGKIAELAGYLDVGFKARFRDKVTIDSQWVDLTLNSAFVPYNNTQANRPMYKERAGIVTIKGCVSPKTEFTSSTDGVIIASGIPSEFRPSEHLQFICQGSGMNRWNCSINTDGTIKIARYGTTGYEKVQTSAWLPFCITYQV